MCKRYLLWVACAAGLAGCTAAETTDDKEMIAGDALYADYKIWGEEGNDAVQVLLQFREGGPEGMAVAVEKTGGVFIDSIPLTADSAGISGAYYEAAFPLATFSGKHTILYKNNQGRQHRQEFFFSPFSITNEPAGIITMQPITLQFSGLPETSTSLRLIITDTSFASNDVNEEVEVENGALTISANMWQALKPGPVMVEIFREEEKSLNEASAAAGRITINYGLKREWLLQRAENKASGQ